MRCLRIVGNRAAELLTLRQQQKGIAEGHFTTPRLSDHGQSSSHIAESANFLFAVHSSRILWLLFPGNVRQFPHLPRFHLLAHRLAVSLHAIDANQDAVAERECRPGASGTTHEGGDKLNSGRAGQNQ